MASVRCNVCGGSYDPKRYGAHLKTQRHMEAQLRQSKRRARDDRRKGKKPGLLSFNDSGSFARKVRRGRKFL